MDVSVIKLAVENKDIDIIKLLCENKCPMDESVMDTAWLMGYCEGMKILSQYGCPRDL